MVGKQYYGLKGFRLNVAVGVIAGLDFLLFGYDQGVMGGLLTETTFLNTFPQVDTAANDSVHTSTIQGITVGAYNLGCFVGAVATIWLGNMLGRKKTIFFGSAIMIVGAIIQTASFSLGQLIAGRVIAGFGNGMNTSTVPTWQSETSKSHNRGQMVMIEGALITCGVMLSYWLDFGFSFLEPNSVSWRLPIAIQIIFALIIVLTILGLPESPRWLIMKGKEDEALNVLCALNDKESSDPYIHNEFCAIKDAAMIMESGTFADLFTMDEDRHFHRVVLAYVNQMFQQISGINLITYYAATIYENDIGLTPQLSRILAAANGTEYFLASWIPVFTIERFGRRTLMLFGAVGMSGTMAILAGTTANITKASGIAAAVFLFVFNTFFAIGWLGMTWLYPAEIVPLRIRAPANALSTSANWIFNFLIVMIAPIMFDSIRYNTYTVFAIINAIIVPCVYFFYPETAGRSLEEMDHIFRKSQSIWDTVRIARDEPRWYDKNGKQILSYEEIEHNGRRRSSAAVGNNSFEEKKSAEGAERLERADVSGSSSIE